MAPRDALRSIQSKLSGRVITAEERVRLQKEFAGEMNVEWLAELMAEFPLAGTVFTIDEDEDPSEMGVEMKWLDVAGLISEARDLYPGRTVVPQGYFPVGECLLGSGDPYFLKMTAGNDPPLVRVPHDTPEDIEEVAESLTEFFKNADLE